MSVDIDILLVQGAASPGLDLPPQAAVQQQGELQMASPAQARHGADASAAAAAAAATAKPGAQLCDAVIDSLRQTKSKVEQSKTQAPGAVAWSQKLAHATHVVTAGWQWQTMAHRQGTGQDVLYSHVVPALVPVT